MVPFYEEDEHQSNEYESEEHEKPEFYSNKKTSYKDIDLTDNLFAGAHDRDLAGGGYGHHDIFKGTDNMFKDYSLHSGKRVRRKNYDVFHKRNWTY